MDKDKLKHLLAGLAIAIMAGLFLYPIIPLIPWRWVQFFAFSNPDGFGIFVAALAGAIKEIIWDWLLKKGTPELLDFVATVAGGVLGAVILHAAR